MINSKLQCRYCSNFRYGEIIVIDVSTGCQDTYDGVCIYDNRRANLVPVNLTDDCNDFISREREVRK